MESPGKSTGPNPARQCPEPHHRRSLRECQSVVKLFDLSQETAQKAPCAHLLVSPPEVLTAAPLLTSSLILTSC